MENHLILTLGFFDPSKSKHNNQWLLQKMVFLNSIIQLKSIFLPHGHDDLSMTITYTYMLCLNWGGITKLNLIRDHRILQSWVKIKNTCCLST